MNTPARVFVAGLVLLSRVAASSAEWTVRWPFHYDGWNAPEIRLAVDGTNGVYALSHSDRFTTLNKWSATGQPLWSRVLSSNAATLAEILIEPGGSVWAGAFTNVYRFSPDGELQRHIPLAEGVRAMALYADSLYVSTYEQVRRYSPAGSVQWSSLSRGGERLVADSEGSAISSGTYFGMPWTRKFSPTGSQLWQVDWAAELSAGPSNTLAVAVLKTAPFYQVLKLSPAGSVEWDRRYVAPIPTYDSVRRVIVDAEGNVYAAGMSGAGYTHGDILLTKFSPGGERLWANRLKASTLYTHPSLVEDLAGPSHGRIAFTGRDYFNSDPGRVAAVTALYDTAGNRIWISREPSGSGNSSSGQSVAFDPNGDLYVAGTTSDTNGSVAYFLVRHAVPELSGLPTLVQPPTDVLAEVGDPVAFSVNAIGAQRYQWLRDDTPIAHATNDTLLLSNVQRLDAGEFAVEVSNEAGAVVTPVGRLWLRPEIIEPPRNVNLAPGDFAGLEVRVPWNTHLRYEWQRDGLPILNATNSILWVTNQSESVYGEYTVQVLDPFGATSEATASVWPPSGVEVIWSRRQHDASEPVAVVSMPDGAVFLAGNEFRNGAPDYFILKRYEANGDEGVRAFYSPGRDAFAAGLLAGLDGNLHVAGSERSAQGDLDFLLASFDTNGATRQVFRWDSGEHGNDEVSACVQDASGSIYLVGTARRPPSSGDVVVLKLTDTTNVAWAAIIPSLSNEVQRATAAAIDPAGNIYVAAEVTRSNGVHVLTLALTPQGQTRWRREWVGAGRADAIAASSDGVCIAGSAGVVLYWADGTERWARGYVGNGRSVHPKALALAPDGDVYIAGNIVARLAGLDGTVRWISTAVSDARRLVFDPAEDWLYAVGSARALAGIRASDGTALWRLDHGASYGEYPATVDAALHVSGDLLVTSQARDGTIDSLTRRYRPGPQTFPGTTLGRMIQVRDGDTIELTESSPALAAMDKRWKRLWTILPGETENRLAIGPIRSIDGALYSLEAWSDSQRVQLPAWNVVFRPSLRAYEHWIEGSTLFVRHDTQLPEDATVFFQSSSDLIEWTTIGTNNLRAEIHLPPVGAGARFFRLVLP